jgi:SnoaL-like domain
MPGTESAMQSVDDLLRKNLEAFGERDAEKRRTAILTIWDSNGVFVDPDGRHIGPEAIDNAIECLLLKFPDFVFRELGIPDSHNGIGRLRWGFGPAGRTPAVTGLDVIVLKAGKIEALYTFLDSHPEMSER